MTFLKHVLCAGLAAWGCSGPLAACAAPPLEVSFDFRDGGQGWEAGFSDYYVGQESEMNLEAGIRDLPEEVGEGTGFWLHGTNRSDDLFMFLKRRLGPEDGIGANRTYKLRFTLTFASNAPSGCMGIGGPPGEAVTLKAGATGVEPLAVVDDGGAVTMNVDKGNQAAGGPAASVVGNIANGIDCDDVPDLSNAPYVSLRRVHWHDCIAESNADGELWLLVGTDSGFEGSTGLYYQRIDVRLLPVFDASAGTRPAIIDGGDAGAVPR
jgi:hypothetical protein